MASQDGAVTIYNSGTVSDSKKIKNPYTLKVGLAQMLRGGAVVQVTSVDQAKLAEDAGACSVLISSGDLRMPDPSLVKSIKSAVAIPVMASCRVGHFVEAQILEALAVDYVDENPHLAAADLDHHINKHNFRSPFVSAAHSLGDALRRIREGAALIRIREGAALIRTVGDLDNDLSGHVGPTIRSIRSIMSEIRTLSNMDDDEVFSFAKRIAAPYDLVAQTKQMGRLPVVQFASGGIVTPADVGMVMQLGCDGVFVGADVFACADAYKRVRGIVDAVRHYNDVDVLVEASSGLEDLMAGLSLGDEDRIQEC